MIYGVDFGSGPDETVVVAGFPNEDGTFTFVNTGLSREEREEEALFIELLRRGAFILIPESECDPDMYIPPGGLP